MRDATKLITSDQDSIDLGNLLRNYSNGIDYYVDSNAGTDGGDDNDGLTWEGAFKTLAYAATQSNITISTHPETYGAGWAARNRIYYKGDSNAENLIILAHKCDIIGVGSGGGHQTMPQIVGTHVIGGGDYVGCRIYNMCFTPTSVGDNIFTIPATCRGLEFHECRFDALGGGLAGSAIVATAVWFMKIIDCEFVNAFSDAAIEILAGNIQGTEILRNFIEGANNGIDLMTGVTSSSSTKVLIKDNVVKTSLICVNDVDSAIAMIIRNNLITLAARGANAMGSVVVGNVDLAQDNRLSASDHNNIIWPAEGALT